MATKTEMVKAAGLADFGTEAQLAKTFNNWQGIGLLGKQENKAPRRGGEGRWHPNQLRLWLWLLQNRAEGVRLATLANSPVGLWLLESEGIRLKQAQRAFAYWANRMIDEPTGANSLRRRAIDEQIAKFAKAGRNLPAERRLRRGIEFLADDVITRETFISQVLEVMTPAGETTGAQRWFAQSAYRALSLRFQALARIDVLTRDTPDIDALWDWAGNVIRSNWGEHQRTWHVLAANPDIGHIFERPEVGGFLNTACSGLLSVFGIGIERQNIMNPSKDVGEPPKVRGLSRG
jgi:hypothetical protein